MKFVEEIKLAVQIAKLDKKAIAKVQKNKDNLGVAIAITAIAGALAGIGNAIMTGGSAATFISGALGSIVGLFVIAGLYQLFSLLFKAKGTYTELIRVLGYAQIVLWSTLIPFLGMIATIWLLVMTTVIISELKKVSLEKAFLIWFLPAVIIFFVLIAILGVAITGLFAGALLAGSI